jgi:hypothetical protein
MKSGVDLLQLRILVICFFSSIHDKKSLQDYGNEIPPFGFYAPKLANKLKVCCSQHTEQAVLHSSGLYLIYRDAW